MQVGCKRSAVVNHRQKKALEVMLNNVPKNAFEQLRFDIRGRGRALLLMAKIRCNNEILNELIRGSYSCFMQSDADFEKGTSWFEFMEGQRRSFIGSETFPDWFTLPLRENIVSIWTRDRGDLFVIYYIMDDAGILWAYGYGEKWDNPRVTNLINNNHPQANH